MRGLPILLVAACASKQPAPTTSVAKPTPQPTVIAPRPAPRPTLTADLVVSTIRDRYLAGVERCYRRHAKLYGASSGRVTLSFTVDRSGQTRDAIARGIARRVDGCITAQLARWQFPAPAKRTQFALSLALSPQ